MEPRWWWWWWWWSIVSIWGTVPLIYTVCRNTVSMFINVVLFQSSRYKCIGFFLYWYCLYKASPLFWSLFWRSGFTSIIPLVKNKKWHHWNQVGLISEKQMPKKNMYCTFKKKNRTLSDFWAKLQFWTIKNRHVSIWPLFRSSNQQTDGLFCLSFSALGPYETLFLFWGDF